MSVWRKRSSSYSGDTENSGEKAEEGRKDKCDGVILDCGGISLQIQGLLQVLWAHDKWQLPSSRRKGGLQASLLES